MPQQVLTTDRAATFAVVKEVKELILQSVISLNWSPDELQTSFNQRSSTRHGAGREKRGIKPYEPGDDIRQIHMAATMAATNPEEIFIRTFFKSSVVRLNVLLSVGPSMHFGTQNTLKSRLGAALAGAGIQSALMAQDIPSFITYGNRPLTIRIEHLPSDILLDSLMHFVEDGNLAEAVPEGGGLAKAYQTINASGRSVVLVVDDFAYTSDADWEALRLLGCQHDVVAAFVQDPRERELPNVPWPGAMLSLVDCLGQTKNIWITPENMPRWMTAVSRKLIRGATVTSRQEYAANWLRHESQIIERLRQCGIKYVTASTDTAKDDVRRLVRELARQTR
jgi:uncharacterized protein (DUF58 family)